MSVARRLCSAPLQALRRYFGAAPAAFPPLPCPAPPVCIIGDLHGRLDLLNGLLAQIERQPGADTARIVFVGDLIDRGPDSAAVLERVRALTEARSGRAQCLMGNHEQMMLAFLDAPRQSGARWIAAGGAETLASFGLSPWASPAGIAPEERLTVLASALRAALPDGMEAWLRQRPLFWQDGGLAISHAGADPGRAMTDQTTEALIWGHRLFSRRRRIDGLWLAHGHVIVERVQAQDGRIAVDTGAWRSGRLSAAWLDETGLSILESVAPA